MKILNINATEPHLFDNDEYNEILINIDYIISIDAKFAGETYLYTEIALSYGGTVKLYLVRETPREVAEMMGYPIPES